MGVAYSTRLLTRYQTPAQGSLPAFKVAAGFRVYVRNINTSGAFATGMGVALWCEPAHLQVHTLWIPTNAPGVDQETMAVFHEGETCNVVVYGSAMVVSLHGYVLEGSGPALSPPPG